MKRYSCALVAVVLGCATGSSSPAVPGGSHARTWAGGSGQLDRTEFEAHAGSASLAEVAQVLGPEMAARPEVGVLMALVKNRTREQPIRVDPSTLRVRLRSGAELRPLSVEEVRAWARESGSSKVPGDAGFRPVDVPMAGAWATAAVFRFPVDADTREIDVSFVLDLGPGDQAQVTSRLFGGSP